jgi:hypothetical protein
MALAHAVQMGNALLALNAKRRLEFVAPAARTNPLASAFPFTENFNVPVATNADLDIAIKRRAAMMANRPNPIQIHPNKRISKHRGIRMYLKPFRHYRGILIG